MAKRSRRSSSTESSKPAAKAQPGDAPAPATSVDVEALARLHIWHVQAVRDVLVVAAVVGVVWVGYALRAVTVPLLVALLLAYVLDPLIERLCRHPRIKRAHAVGGLLAAGGVLVLVVVGFALPLVAGQTAQLVRYVGSGELRTRLTTLADEHVPESYRGEVGSMLEILPAGRASDVASVAPVAGAPPDPSAAEAAADGAPLTRELILSLVDDRLAESAAPAEAAPRDADVPGPDVVGVVRRQLEAIVRVLGAVVQIGLVTFLIPFYFFFFSLWYPHVVRFGRELLPQKNRERTLELLGKMDRVIAGFVRGRIVISLIMGVMLAVGWMICGVPYAIMLGFVVGIFCAVPYLGIIGIPIAVGMLLLEQFGLPEAERMGLVWVLVWPTAVFSIVQLVEGYVLTPMIAGKATNLDPVTILVAVLAGGSVLGVYGMLLAIPLAACSKIVLMEILLPRVHAWLRGEVADPLPIERKG